MADGELGSYSGFMPSFALFLPNIDFIYPRLRLVIFDHNANGLTSDILGHVYTGIDRARIVDARMVERGGAGWWDWECGRGSRDVDRSGT